jgi:excinuclease ABC subunit A
VSEPKPSAVIRLRRVRHNNLKNFDLDLPLHRLIVITGLSGSGKSSLAFDTLYAEGQRRYIETFSPYARQFFDRMDKPQVDSIDGIPPAIAIEQRNAVRTTRSTVGTMTEICDHMKVLWPHLAQLHCRGCGQPVRKDSPQSVWEMIQKSEVGGQKSEVLITFDVPLSDKLPLAESLALISKQGYQRLLLNGAIVRLEEATSHFASHTSHLTVIQDRVKLAPATRARFVEACEQAYHFGKGKLTTWEIHPPSSILHPRFTLALSRLPIRKIGNRIPTCWIPGSVPGSGRLRRWAGRVTNPKTPIIQHSKPSTQPTIWSPARTSSFSGWRA